MGVEVVIASAAALSKVAISNGHCNCYLASMGDDTRASDRWGPGGIATKLDPEPSRPFTVSMNLVNISAFVSTSPKLIRSTLT